MKRIIILTFFILISCSSKEHELYQQKPAFYSYIIGDVKSKNVEEKYNQDAYITPASCQKTITSLVAYKTLGKDFAYKTKVYITQYKGVIGDVVIEFSGDPTLTSERLSNLLEPLKHRIIKGQIIVDASGFQTPAISKNNIIDDIGQSYSSPIYGANLDKNLINVTFIIDKLSGKIIAKNDAGYSVLHDIKISDEKSKIKLEWEGNLIKASGNIKANQEPLTIQTSPSDIDFYLTNKIKNILNKNNIQAKIIVQKDRTQIPADKKLLIESSSESLNKIMSLALKKSDNMVFDSIYLTILNKSGHEINSWNDGNPIMKLLVKEHFDIDLKNALIVDGSGLSRYNRIQTEALFELLKKGYEIKEFANLMPSSGEIGTTLETRNLLPTIKAKTGSMSGMSCLCGYNINNDSVKAFAIVANNFEPPLTEVYKVQDKFINSQFE